MAQAAACRGDGARPRAASCAPDRAEAPTLLAALAARPRARRAGRLGRLLRRHRRRGASSCPPTPSSASGTGSDRRPAPATSPRPAWAPPTTRCWAPPSRSPTSTACCSPAGSSLRHPPVAGRPRGAGHRRCCPAPPSSSWRSGPGDQVGCDRVEELTLQAPLVLPEQGAVQLQVVVGAADDARPPRRSACTRAPRAPRPRSRGPGTPPARSTARRRAGRLADLDRLAARRTPRRSTSTRLYERLAEAGFGYGPGLPGPARRLAPRRRDLRRGRPARAAPRRRRPVRPAPGAAGRRAARARRLGRLGLLRSSDPPMTRCAAVCRSAGPVSPCTPPAPPRCGCGSPRSAAARSPSNSPTAPGDR